MFIPRLCLVAVLFLAPATAPAARDSADTAELAGDAAGNAEANTLTAEESASGWKLLFDGKAANGLRGLKNREFLKAGWKIQNGALILPKEISAMGKVTGGDLATNEAFTDFEFAFQWKLGVSSNTGIVYFARSGVGSARPSGCEFQIIDDVHHPDGLKGGPIRRTGALYGILPPVAEKTVNEPGHWNAGKIRVQGNRVEHWLNGAKVLEYDLGSAGLQKAIVASRMKVPTGFGMAKFKAPLVILDEGDELALRGLKVRAIVETSVPVPAAGAVQRPTVPPAR